MIRKLGSLTLLVLVMIASITPIYSQTSGRPESKTLLLIIPGVSPSILSRGEPLKSYLNNSMITRVKPIPIYNELFHELLLLNTSWSLRKAIVHNTTVDYYNGSTAQPWEALDYRLLETIWGNTTVFINLKAVNPLRHNTSLNPYFNLTKQIPPQILVVPINGSMKWSILNTTVNITLSNGVFRISLPEYNIRSVVFSNETNSTDPIFINVSTPNLPVPIGKYHLKFRIIDYNETHVKIFTLGSRETTDWLSSSFGIFVKPVTPDIPVEYFKYLGEDDIKWCVEEVLSFYREMVGAAYRYRGATLEVLEIPLFTEVNKAYVEGYINDTLKNVLEETIVNGVNDILNVTRLRLGGINVIIYIPYTYVEEPERIRVNGLTPIEPGYYKVSNTSLLNNVVDKLLKRGIEFRLLNISGEVYVEILSGEYVINGYGGVGEGYLIVYPSTIRGESSIVVDAASIVGYIVSLARGYGIGLSVSGALIESLRSRIGKLNDQIRDLNGTIRALNDRIGRLNTSLARCRAKYINLSANVSSILDELEQARARERQYMIYATTGTISILVVVLLLYYIGRRGLAKKR